MGKKAGVAGGSIGSAQIRSAALAWVRGGGRRIPREFQAKEGCEASFRVEDAFLTAADEFANDAQACRG